MQIVFVWNILRDKYPSERSLSNHQTSLDINKHILDIVTPFIIRINIDLNGYILPCIAKRNQCSCNTTLFVVKAAGFKINLMGGYNSSIKPLNIYSSNIHR